MILSKHDKDIYKSDKGNNVYFSVIYCYIYSKYYFPFLLPEHKNADQ